MMVIVVWYGYVHNTWIVNYCYQLEQFNYQWSDKISKKSFSQHLFYDTFQILLFEYTIIVAVYCYSIYLFYIYHKNILYKKQNKILKIN